MCVARRAQCLRRARIRWSSGCFADLAELREPGPDASGLSRVLREFGGRRAAHLEQRPGVHEALQLQVELVEAAVVDGRRHATASSAATPASPSSTSVEAGLD